MNKRGQTVFVSIMVGMVFFLLGLALSYPLNSITQTARAETNTTAGVEVALNCSTVTEYQDKANCTAVDMFNPLWTGVLFGLGAMIIGRIFL